MMEKLLQTKCPLRLWVHLFCALTMLAACNEHHYPSPEGYDLHKPEKMELGKVLNEISGITYYQENNALLAISDSKEKIFEINIEKRKLKDYTDKVVGSQQDLEDLVKLDSAVYLLSSKGLIYKIPVNNKSISGVSSFPFWSKDKNDFETLYYDAASNGLIMMCKTCPSDKGKNMRTAYRFDLVKEQFDSSAFYIISTEDIKKIGGANSKFDPSAAAIHPITKQLYILSSAGNLLVIADTQGKPAEVYHLDPSQFPQAEGIAFAPNGDMYISNEGKLGKATLQIFHYEKQAKKQ